MHPLQARALHGVQGLPATSDVTRLVSARLTPQQEADVGRIRGHLVLFPLQFLADEDLQPRGLTKEAMVPAVFT